jgi:hypothetical protein
MKFVDAVVLLGWFERDLAIEFLRKRCRFDPPLSESKARRLWEKYRRGVDALGVRDAQAPSRNALAPNEQAAADALLQAFRGSKNVKDVLKVDPRELVVHQLIVYTDHASAKYASSVCDSNGWIKEALPLPKPTPSLRTLRAGPNMVHLDAPHAEFGIIQDVATGEFRVFEMARHVSTTAYKSADFKNRMLLGAGYHRTYPCISSMSPDAIDRSLPMVLTTDADFLVSPAAPNQGLRAILCGPRPPLFADFFDDCLAINVQLQKVRYELHVSAQVVCFPVF